MQKNSPLPILMPQCEWNLPLGFKVPKRGSNLQTAAGGLVGATFQWLIKYRGTPLGGQTASLPAAETLLGT